MRPIALRYIKEMTMTLTPLQPKIWITAISVLTLTACATGQENPNYTYSSQYKGAPASSQTSTVIAPTTQAASYTQTVQAPAPYAPQAITQDYGPILYREPQQAVYTAQTPNPAPSAYEQPALAGGPVEAAYTSPTEQAYVGQVITGTPGYMAMQNQTVSADIPTAPIQAPMQQQQTAQTYTVPASVTISAPTPAPLQPVNYGYGNLYDAPGTVSASTTSVLGQVPQIGGIPMNGGSYTIKEGEHLWPIKTQLCVDLVDIKNLNPQLNASFDVWPGNVIRLPASRCAAP